jgi:hypothetical protein
MNGIIHKMGAPFKPSTNGQAERYVQIVKHKLKTMKMDAKSDLELNLNNILLQYRKTVHPATGKSPSMIVFNRQMRSRLDLIIPSRNSAKTEMKSENVRNLNINDKVICRDYAHKNVKWQFGQIVQKLGKLHYMIKISDGRIWKRHIDQIRLVGDNITINNEKKCHWPLQTNVNNDNELNSDYNNEQLFSTSNSEDSDQFDSADDFGSGSFHDSNLQQTNAQNFETNSRNVNTETADLGIRRSSRIKKIPQRLNL